MPESAAPETGGTVFEQEPDKLRQTSLQHAEEPLSIRIKAGSGVI